MGAPFSWWNQSVTRIRPGTKTERGSVIPDWEHADTITISRCSVQPAATSLSQDGRVLGISDGMTVYMPAGSDVQAGDRIGYGGKVYVITGDIRAWPSATGGLDHIQLSLERWEG